MSNTERLNSALAGRYKIEKQLGQGGMATVYLAQDIKHDRKVAVKVLKPELAAVLGAERFVVEIKTTAALQHPHILPLFDSGTADGFLYYVMPYIEGETLRDRLNRENQLGVDDAIRITTEVADALNYAHRHGVIHRDIKPENILLHDGRPMVADFGIALAVSAAAGGRMTETGLSLGTPHYMSPEQATAEKDITARSDIYSLASVMYEMLAGAPPHSGGSAQQIIMRIITDTARPVTELRKSVPPHIAAALARALEKLPADRFASASEFAAALKDRAFTTSQTGWNQAVTGRPAVASWVRDPRTIATIALAAFAVTFAVLSRAPRRVATEPAAARFAVSVSADTSLVTLAARTTLPLVSNDGRYLTFGGTALDGLRLYVRPLAVDSLQRIPGEATGPFFSPDGQSLGFFRNSEVWRYDLRENLATLVAKLPERSWDIYDGHWHPDGRILVAGASGVWQIHATGGEPSLLIPSDSLKFELPIVLRSLDDGRLLVTLSSAKGSRHQVFAARGGSGRDVLPGVTAAEPIGDIIVFQQSGQWRAAHFDQRRVALVGSPLGIELPSLMHPGRSIAWTDATGGVQAEPVWVSQAGVATAIGLPKRAYRWPRISRDQSRLVIGASGPGSPLTVTDVRNRTTYTIGGYTEPVWMPDGRSIITSIGNRPGGGLARQSADGSRGGDTLLSSRASDSWPTDISADSRHLAWYGGGVGEAGDGGDPNDPSDVFIMELKTRKSKRLVLPGDQKGARFSPDARWLAYQSTESGRQGIHVRPFPALDANWVISTDGGTEPLWSPSGRTLYFRQQESVMAVDLTFRGSTVERSPVRTLFRGIYFRDPYGDSSWDIAPDGRFVMLRPVRGSSMRVDVMLNWISEIRARLDRASAGGK